MRQSRLLSDRWGPRDGSRTVLAGGEPSADVPLAAVLVVFAAAYLPFVGKAFHLDDPMYLWAARHIGKDPLDFYGFVVNWHGTATPMAAVMKNPPLTSYFIAGATAVLGWSEPALHLAFIAPAIAAVWGTYSLARLLSAPPGVAALAVVCSPVFLVSSTTVMSDVLLTAAWVWAVVLWLQGIERNRWASLAASAALIAVAALCKYFGIALVPLLAAYTLLERRRPLSLAWLLVPLMVMGLFEAYTARLYGRGLWLDAAVYAGEVRHVREWNATVKVTVGLSFLGGCYLPVLLFAGKLWRRRGWLAGAAIAIACAAMLAATGSLGAYSFAAADGMRWRVIVQVAVLVAAGAGVVALAVLDLAGARDAKSALLGLWVLGTLAFAVSLNWSVNARSLLPMAPAVGVLLARRLDELGGARTEPWIARWGPMLASAMVAVAIAYADYRLAGTARDAATEFASVRQRGGTAWFEGHWGFQYYAEEQGLVPLDSDRSVVRHGDIIIVPGFNSNLFALPEDGIVIERVATFPVWPVLTTMNGWAGAGFYSDVAGPLPFAVGPVAAERYAVVEAKSDFRP